MLPFIGPLLSAGSSLLGGLFSSNTAKDNTQANIQAQAAAQQQSEQFNASQAQLNRDFQQNQSSTAYQRASADMKAAGLNPSAMFGSGSAASTPGGSAASISTPNVSSINQKTSAFAGLGGAVSQAINSAVSVKTLDKMTEEIANLQAQQARTAAETNLTKANIPLAEEKTKTQLAETGIKEADRMKGVLSIPAARFSAKEAGAKMDLPDWMVNTAVQGGYLAEKGGKVIDAVSSAIPGVSVLKKAMRGYNSRSTTERTNARTGDSSFEERFTY